MAQPYRVPPYTGGVPELLNYKKNESSIICVLFTVHCRRSLRPTQRTTTDEVSLNIVVKLLNPTDDSWQLNKKRAPKKSAYKLICCNNTF